MLRGVAISWSVDCLTERSEELFDLADRIEALLPPWVTIGAPGGADFPTIAEAVEYQKTRDDNNQREQ
jgi:hypothetical protein